MANPLLVVAAVINHHQRHEEILLCRRPPQRPLPGLWEIPGGVVEEKETRVEALERELQEEVGMGYLVSQLGHHPRTIFSTEVVAPHGVFLVDFFSIDNTSPHSWPQMRHHNGLMWCTMHDAYVHLKLSPATEAFISDQLGATATHGTRSFP